MAGLSVHEALAAGDLAGALASQKAAIRQAPTIPELRFLLFQLQSLAGDWTAAANQLAAQCKLLAAEPPFLKLMEDLVRAEQAREEVFRGAQAPTILGEPPSWVASLARALALSAQGRPEEAGALRQEALCEASPSAGLLNGEAFASFVDGDSRLGPVIEIILQGAYRWLPVAHVQSIAIEPPEQPRDLVWAVAQVTLERGATLPAFLPARYPHAATWENDGLRLGRRTEWHSPAAGCFEGRGQRIWMADATECAALEVRSLAFSSPAA